jgi:ribulose 1,5-bisphosphate synthetase/thiazole synthase
MNSWEEPSRKIPIHTEVDVLVVGGGPAGIAASLASSRHGARTMIIERYGFLGGCSTMAGVTTICGLFLTKKEEPVPVIKGIAWELVENLKLLKAISDPIQIGKSFLVVFDGNRLKEISEKMLQESGVSILYHVLATDVIRDGNTVKGVILESKRGREGIFSKIVIDATGDGDLSTRAGAPYKKEDQCALQFPTLMFKMNNVNVEKAKRVSREAIEEAMKKATERGEFDLPRISGTLRLTPLKGEAICNLTRISRRDKISSIDGTDPEDLTFAEMEGRRQIREYEAFLRRHIPGFEEAYVSQSGPQIGIRETRLIQGEFTLSKEDVLGARKFKDGVIRSSWPLEIHGADKGTLWVWLPEGDFYEVPYRCLVPLGVENLLTAGRCISTTHEAQASTRVSACCYGTGQAAGNAAAIAIRKSVSPRMIDVAELQVCLTNQGCLI